MNNSISTGYISPEEIFMTQMKVVYFLIQASLAGSLLCFIFRLVIFGVLVLQLFFLLLNYANTLRIEYCRRHNIMRTQGETIIWRISLVVIQLLSCFVVFNLLFTVISIFLGNTNKRNEYYNSLTNNIQSDKKIEISLSIQIVCLVLQCAIIYLFFFKKDMQQFLLKPEAILDKLVIKDLSQIPDDRNECIICLEEMKPCPNSPIQQDYQQVQLAQKQSSNLVQDNIMRSINVQCFNLNQHTNSDQPILSTFQNNNRNSKILGDLNQNNSNLMKIDSIKDDENQTCSHKITQQTEGDYNVKHDEDQQKIPAFNINILKRITNSKRFKQSEGFKSMIVINDNNYFDQLQQDQPISCNDFQKIDNNNNIKLFHLQSRVSSHKSSHIEGEKSTHCDSQCKQDSHYDQADQQIENLSSQYKADIENGKGKDGEQQNQESFGNKNCFYQDNENNQFQSLKSENEEYQKNTSNNQELEIPQILNIESRQQSELQNNNIPEIYIDQQQSQQQQQQHPLFFNFEQPANKQKHKPQQSKLIVQLKCKHYFHLDCIKEWLKTSKNLRCPTCRQNFIQL